jgi:hypothetical protein
MNDGRNKNWQMLANGTGQSVNEKCIRTAGKCYVDAAKNKSVKSGEIPNRFRTLNPILI